MREGVEREDRKEVVGNLLMLLPLLLLCVLLLLLRRRSFFGRRYVFIGHFLEFNTVVAIVFIHIEDVVYLLFGLVERRAEAIGTAYFPLEGGNVSFRVVAGVGLEDDVGVAFFAVDLCRYGTVFVPCD